MIIPFFFLRLSYQLIQIKTKTIPIFLTSRTNKKFLPNNVIIGQEFFVSSLYSIPLLSTLHTPHVMDNNSKWKIRSASIPIKNDSTPEIVRLYTRHESRQKNATLQNNLVRHSHPILQAARSEQKQTISSHISALAEKLISKEKDIHLDAYWNNKSEIKDAMKIAEDKMYQGWTL